GGEECSANLYSRGAQMDCRHLVVATTLLASGIHLVRNAEAALVSGDPIGTSGYHITGIDPGVVVDFTATASTPANSNTIGKLTVTMSHANLNFLGFSLIQEAATQTSLASGGLRLLVDLVDTNGMNSPWTDYHIRAIDNTTPANPGSEIAHLS